MYYNIGKSIPMMSLFEPAQGNAKLGGFDWIPGVLQPSGPYVTLLANTLLNVDPFTGKPIYNETDDNLDKAMKSGKAVWDTFAPAPLTFRTGGQVMDWAQDKEGPTGKPNDGLVFARLFGLSVYQYDRSETDYYQNAEIKKIKSEFKKVMNQAKRDEMSKGYPDYEALDAKLDKLSEGLEQRIAEIRGDE
jgi:Txe/YoeB family toxin of Txe-Axe toxin-antitoxin module